MYIANLFCICYNAIRQKKLNIHIAQIEPPRNAVPGGSFG